MSQEKQLFINLIQKHQNASLTEQEKVLLEEMINHDERYAELFRISTQSSLPQSNIEKAYAKAQELIATQNHTKQARIYKLAWWKYAVAACILICSVFAVLQYQSSSSQEMVYEVPMGKRATYVLADGSSVSLNGGSKLIIDEHFGKDNRLVTLYGEGFFDVKHDVNNPFIVSSKSMKIKVLGTAFNVRDYDDDDIKQTTLLRGKVELTYNNEAKTTSYTLLPGDKISFTKATENQHNKIEKAELKIVREKINGEKQLENTVAWKDGILVFDNEPLPLVASKLEKWFNVSIEFKDDSLHEKRFTGSFENLSLEKILSLIKETGGVKNIGVVNNTIIIE